MQSKILGLLALAIVAAPASASVVAVGAGAFGAGSTLTTFTGLADGTEVNGLVVDGITFQYSLGDGLVIINGGPGETNNVSPQNVVSIGDPAGVLTMVLPSLVNAFGYGFAILSSDPIASATTMSLFNGATAVGSLSFSGAPDPAFAGGFAGLQSTLAFDRIQVIFSGGPAFALDNIRTANINVPEPGTLALLGLGIVGLGLGRRRKAA